MFYFKVLLLVLFPSVLYANAIVPLEFRHKNYNSHCVWCCLATAARHQGVTSLYNVLKEVDSDPRKRKDGAVSFLEIHQLLRKKKVAHFYQKYGDRDLKDIKKALKRRIPVIVSFKNPPGVRYSHAVLLTGISLSHALYIDPDAHVRVTRVTRREFSRLWNGQALFLDYNVPARRALPSEHVRLLVAHIDRKLESEAEAVFTPVDRRRLPKIRSSRLKKRISR